MGFFLLVTEVSQLQSTLPYLNVLHACVEYALRQKKSWQRQYGNVADEKNSVTNGLALFRISFKCDSVITCSVNLKEKMIK